MLDNRNTRSLQELAELLVGVKHQLAPLEQAEKDLKSEITFYEGEKITTSDGSKVSISHSSQDRPDGTRLEFNESAFYDLDLDMRVQLEKLGVVTFVPKIIRGVGPRVTVKLA